MKWSTYRTIGSASFLALCVTGAGTVHAGAAWSKKEECRLVEDSYRDGDSFHARMGMRTYVLRLYFVDCPETDTRYPERVKEQAAYWNISEDDALAIGKKATDFTRDYLKNGFTVHTKFEDAMGSGHEPRDFALVESKEGDLGVALVANGLARIYGEEETPPWGPSATLLRFRLKTAEAAARKAGLGAWGIGGKNRTTTGTAAPAPAPLEMRTITLARTVSVYSLLPPYGPVGLLTAGKQVTVMQEERPGMVRVRFRASTDRVVEAQVQRSELGI